MLVIGLTGGIASGKSTVSKALVEAGVPVFDADEASRQAVAPGSRGLQLVAQALGSEYIDAEGCLKRQAVADLIFHNQEAKAALEHILHGVVWQAAEDFLADCRTKEARLAVLDVPLLIECGWHQRVDQVWLVSVEEEQQIIRAMARSGMTREQVTDRIKAQLSLAEKSKHARVIIDNSGSLENTLRAVAEELEKLKIS